MRPGVLVTGATGQVGGETLSRLLRANPGLRAFVLVRDERRWQAVARRLRLPDRVVPVSGDVTLPGLGLARPDRARMRDRVRAIVHAAADTCFSRPLPASRRVNRDGTVHAVELALSWKVERFVFVSTAYVAGRMSGDVPEAEHDGRAGWVNAYERSKYEAEAAVRASDCSWVVFRPSTIVCETGAGGIAHVNAVHRALTLYRQGLAPLLPGDDETPIDLVTNDFVSGAIGGLALRDGADRATYHLCAGAGALPLGELLDRSLEVWREDPEWRRRGVLRPALTDLATYRLFERTVMVTGDERLRRITRSLSHFVPQLALPKRFETTSAEAALGRPAPPVREYWRSVLIELQRRGRSRPARAA